MHDLGVRLKESARLSASSPWFLWILAVMILIPLAAAAGQFLWSGFLVRSTPFLVLFWPGAEWRWAPALPVWLTMGAMGASYVVGDFYLVRRRTLGNVVLWTIGAVIVANVIGFGINRIAGWREMQTAASVATAGKANALIYSLWQNPLWEELVFRGIPLLVLIYVKKRLPNALKWTTVAYIVIPNIIFAWYHVPGHGPARIADTMILGCAFSWMAVRYTFFAPLVMHYLLDAMLIVQLHTLPNIPADEVSWLVDNSAVVNTSWSLALIAAVLSIPVITVVSMVRGRRPTVAADRGPDSAGMNTDSAGEPPVRDT